MGFPRASNFLKFMLESARLSFTLPGFKTYPVPHRFGPQFVTSMFVSKINLV